MCFVLLCLFLAEKLLGFKVCGTERKRSGKIFMMPSHAEWLDMLSQGVPSSMLGSGMSPRAVRRPTPSATPAAA